MNLQFPRQFPLGNSAPLASVAIPSTGYLGLTLPAGTIIGITSAPPSGILFARHCGAMGNIKTSLAAITPLYPPNLIRLTFKLLATSRAGQRHTGRLRHNAIGTLPGATASTVAKVMRPQVARRNSPFAPAPVAVDKHRRMSALGVAIMDLVALGVPALAFKPFSAGSACDYHSLIVPRNVSPADVGSEMIGAMLAGWDEIVGVEMLPEYANIARARLAHWAGASQMELFNGP